MVLPVPIRDPRRGGAGAHCRRSRSRRAEARRDQHRRPQPGTSEAASVGSTWRRWPSMRNRSDGDFVLTFDVPRRHGARRTRSPGRQNSRFGRERARTLYGSGFGMIGFTFQEIGGTKHGEQVWHADCGHHAIAADAPLTRALQLGVGWTAEDPDASFYAAFAADPGRHLPVGDWQLTALALFDERPCTGRSRAERCAGSARHARRSAHSRGSVTGSGWRGRDLATLIGPPKRRRAPDTTGCRGRCGSVTWARAGTPSRVENRAQMGTAVPAAGFSGPRNGQIRTQYDRGS